MVTQERARRPGLRLTARGAIALVFVCTLLAQAAASSTIVGLVFCVACLAGVLLVQPRELLSLVVTPPLVFFVATLVGAVVGALGAPSLVQALGVGLFTDLSAGAPWLFAGSALVLGVAWFRGLTESVSELRAELRANRAAASAAGARGRRSGPEAPVYAPEPEGYFEPRVYGSAREQGQD
ncbi:hypothetical protein Ssi03_39680 [Sphaerisporangium siamense]|uniref:DUF6542 domain-containing protein n=1 Tax=Sphaerisporangium siamense TaxID=795645 RepID=A0A7W7D5Y6_9ACTN|nr:DUF6542 domain-containing protein [Sphaerisporangium siamense]MBB4700877.1 hypothetical protein [Sphaerisporangium siamense]GII85978.1 hypothetical protein Ssi03_39680 [Sphaerisporangium siamense]